MSVKIIQGNILDSKADYICHQVNCQGAMNSGVAKAIRQKWPKVYERYYNSGIDVSDDDDFTETHMSWTHMLGKIQCVVVEENKVVINMFAQENYGYNGLRYTSYDAFWSCLGELREAPKGSTIAFPYMIGCVRGGARWNIIYTMIVEALGEDYNVEFWRLDNG